VSGSIGSTRTLTFSAAGITGVTSASLTAVTTAGAPASVVPLQGAGQSATVATAVATPPAVTVTDAAGNPVSGHPVMFAVTAGGGSVTGSSASTDASGVATLGSWTLGATAGSNSISATASGLSAVGFTATGTVGAAAQLGIMTAPVSGGTSEALLTTQPVVRLEDVHGNPITTSGVSVTVAISSGSVTGTTTITTTNGVAAFVNLSVSGVLGATPTLTFSSAGLASVTSPALAAFATAGAPYLISVTSGNGQSAQVNTAVAVAPTVTVTDRQGNAVAGVVVTFTPSNAGTVTPSATVTTNASGVATAGTWTLGATTGAQTLQAGANGVAPVTISATATP
jgi:adhesin/invasin